MDTTLGALLHRLRRAKGFTLADLAERVGVTPGYLSMIENRRVENPPSMKVVIRLEAALGVHDCCLCHAAEWERTPAPIREELERTRRSAASQAGPVHVPLINKVTAGYPAEFTDLGYPARVGDDVILVPGYTGLHGGNDPDAFAATVCGDSMNPDYREGDIVVFSPMADVIDGSDCFARLEPDHESTFKRVYFDPIQNTIRLEPLNKAYATRTVEREQVAGLFRAVWRMSRVSCT